MTDERMIVTPLVRLLMGLTLDELIDTIDKMYVQWSLTRDRSGKYQAAVYARGTVRYEVHESAGKSESPKAVFVRALAKFLVGEQRDFHDFVVEEFKP